PPIDLGFRNGRHAMRSDQAIALGRRRSGEPKDKNQTNYYSAYSGSSNRHSRQSSPADKLPWLRTHVDLDRTDPSIPPVTRLRGPVRSHQIRASTIIRLRIDHNWTALRHPYRAYMVRAAIPVLKSRPVLDQCHGRAVEIPLSVDHRIASRCRRRRPFNSDRPHPSVPPSARQPRDTFRDRGLRPTVIPLAVERQLPACGHADRSDTVRLPFPIDSSR